MPENLSDMPLHQRLQRAINRQVERGASDDDVAEAAFTVALANLVAVKGATRAAYAAIAAGGGLKLLAEQAEADQAAPRH